MLFAQSTLASIADGTVTVAFRRWRRPTVRAGGTLMTSIGVLAIEAVDRVRTDDLTEADARAAGHGDRAGLLKKLGDDTAVGEVYRIAFTRAGPDPRTAMRSRIPESAEEFDRLVSQLARWDASEPAGPWTRRALELIRLHPGGRAGDLADLIGMEMKRFKNNVRKLKRLGLTESLEVGYRLSPRGKAVLDRLA